MAEERLQKILANAGIASRRKAEELIVTGHVSVNGVTVTTLGSKADLAVDEVKCDGQRLKAPKHYVYFAFNKPKNVMTTVNDPERRETVMHFFKGLKERIYPVGRLDYASEGLLLLTNDGEFANLISSPAAHVPKTYLVKVNGILTAEQQETFRRGIPMHGQRTAPAKLKVVRSTVNPWYEVTIAEGRQNQIRIMFKHFGFLVEKLRRIRIGFLDLGNLKGGAYRTLTREEVDRFRRMLKMDGAEAGETPERSAERPDRTGQPPQTARPDRRDVRKSRPPGNAAGGSRPPVYPIRTSRPATSRTGQGVNQSGPPTQHPHPSGQRWQDSRARTVQTSNPAGQSSRGSRPPMPSARGPRPPVRDAREPRPAGQWPQEPRSPARTVQGSNPAGQSSRGSRPPMPRVSGPRPPVRNARGPRPTGQRPQESRSAARPERGPRSSAARTRKPAHE